MKNVAIILLSVVSLAWAGCNGAGGEDPGSAYMPDMYYSRAFEAYNYNNVEGELDSLQRRGIYYSAMPVPGTVARGENYIYHLTGDSAGLKTAQTIVNPLDTLAANPAAMKEAERLYLIHCGICHGAKMDGNGPLFNGGNGPFAAAPRNLTDAYTKALTDGHMYWVITYGIRTMGSYSSQLSPEQRWWVVKYIRSKQGGGVTPALTTDSLQAPPQNRLPANDTTNQR